MAHLELIETVEVPAEIRKKTTFARACYYESVQIYENRVVGLADGRQMTWYYKDYHGIDIVEANINSQFAQIVFLTGNNSNNRVVGLDFSSSQNQAAMQDTNRLIFCSGMLKWKLANQFASSLGAKIRAAMDTYKNDEEKSSSEGFSAADELKKYKELLDSGVITQEEFDAKKKQLLGL